MVNTSISKNTLYTSIGSALEYYDFVTYIMLADILSQVFFKNMSHFMALISTLSIFVLGYIIRPVGGILFGVFADRYGRKQVFLAAISLMAISTFLIGLLPTQAMIGELSTVLLLILRLIQGISQGAELPGGITFVCEHAKGTRRGLACSIIFAMVGLGAMLSSIVNGLLHHLLTTPEMLSYGWRIPFLLGGSLGIVAYIFRKKTTETPLFLKAGISKKRSPLKILLSENSLAILTGIGLMLFAASLIVFGLYIPTYVEQYFGYSSDFVYTALSIGLLICSILMPVFGIIGDVVGRRLLLSMTAFITVILIYSMFELLIYKSNTSILIFVILLEVLIAASASCYPAMLAESFRTEVRYTGVAITYNITYVIAAMTPLAITLLLHHYAHPLAAAFIFAILAIIAMISCLCFRIPTDARH